MTIPGTPSNAERNRKSFIAFRTLFNARFYYPVLAVLFLDLGLSASEYSLLNFVWAIVIVFAEVPSGALADRIGRRPLIVAAAICMVLEMLVLLTLTGLACVALKIPFWGVLFAFPLAAAMSVLAFFISNTLNALVSSEQRATVLSFKGLIFNLGYGFASLVFALGLRSLRDQGSTDQAFADAIEVLPLWLLFTLIVLALMFKGQRAALKLRPIHSGQSK